jgi:hypothetical protein
LFDVGFSCLFAHLFQPCIIIQKIMQPGLQCSLVLQKEWKKLSSSRQCFGLMFCITCISIKPTISPTWNVVLITGIPSCVEEGGLFFKFVVDTKFFSQFVNLHFSLVQIPLCNNTLILVDPSFLILFPKVHGWWAFGGPCTNWGSWFLVHAFWWIKIRCKF